jgi:hypothetical protein
MSEGLMVSPTAPTAPTSGSALTWRIRALTDVPPEIEWFANIDNRQTGERIRSYIFRHRV